MFAGDTRARKTTRRTWGVGVVEGNGQIRAGVLYPGVGAVADYLAGLG